jgi:DNA-directed RNA polymerase subunit RPC12/RpoP
LARLISPLNPKKADEILPSTATSHLWRCPVCGGDYNATVVDMENGYTCPYCNERKLLKEFNSFGERHSELVLELYEPGNVVMGRSPFEMLSSSADKLWWTCCKDEKHKYSERKELRDPYCQPADIDSKNNVE